MPVTAEFSHQRVICRFTLQGDILTLMNMHLHRKSTFLVVLLAILALPSCGERESESAEAAREAPRREVPPPPTPEEAAEIVAKAPEFSDFRFTSVTLSIPAQESMMHDQMRSYVRDLEQAGWLRVDRTGTVVLADKARRDSRWVERPNQFFDIAPLARKELVEVTRVYPAEGSAVNVDFTYEWVQNPTGAALQRGPLRQILDSHHYATATLQDFGDGWEVYIIRENKTAPGSETAPDESE
jgi:hypothetical protein